MRAFVLAHELLSLHIFPCVLACLFVYLLVSSRACLLACTFAHTLAFAFGCAFALTQFKCLTAVRTLRSEVGAFYRNCVLGGRKAGMHAVQSAFGGEVLYLTF